jgi:hypothetical protein
MFEFKFQKWFDQILGSIEFPTNFRIFELLNLIQIKPNGKRQTALFIWAKTGQATMGWQPIDWNRGELPHGARQWCRPNSASRRPGASGEGGVGNPFVGGGEVEAHR